MRVFPRIFYGWWILAAGCAAQTLVGATQSYGFALFFIPLTAEFGWSRAAISGAISLARLEGGLLGPIEGLLVDRLGPRRMMLLGVPMIGIGFYLLGQLSWLAEVTHLSPLVTFYLVYVLLMALGASIGTSMATSTAVANWFIRRRGFALGILSSGLAIGAATLTPVLGQIIQSAGWRQAAVTAAVAVVVIGMPAALVMRHRPEPYGYRPDGDPVPAPEAESQAAPVGENRELDSEQDFTLRQALGTSAFWVMAFAFGLRIMVTSAVIIHLAPLIQDLGMSTVEAAGVLSALATISIFGRLGLGWLGDKFDKRRVYLGALVTMTGGVLLLAYATEFWQVLLFLLCYGPSYGGLAALQFALRADYFGRRAFATIAGAMGPVTTLGTVMGPLFAGYVFDTTGSYRAAMLVFAGCTLVTLLLIWFLRRPQLPSSTTTAPLASESV